MWKAVEELHEIKEFLENPKKFQALGARIPKGVLLYGPPGTARRCWPARSPARPVSRSSRFPGLDFVEMFVGVGASRVRDLFEQAKQASPCIVFMDEIDAVGRHRGAGLAAATTSASRPKPARRNGRVRAEGQHHPDRGHEPALDILDPALLRPGRASTGRSSSTAPTGTAARRSPRCTRRASPGQRDRARHARRRDARLHGRRPGEPCSTAALLAARRGRKTIGQDELEEADHARDRRPREKKTRPSPRRSAR